MNNLSEYDLYTESEKNASDTNHYANGKAEVQASLASGGLISAHYLQEIDSERPYTSQWFYQPGLGWLWTNRETFPFLYRSEDSAGGTSAGWLYLRQDSNQTQINLYEYESGGWIEMDF